MTSQQLEGIGLLVLALLAAALPARRRTRKRSAKKQTRNSATSGSRRKSSVIRPDDQILTSALDSLSWGEFERLLALYFRDNGYSVKETGIGGNDGGVDLVITDNKTGEKTAVQAKCYEGNVGVPYVRELIGAKRNHNCVLTLLVTTADLTEQAKKEADANHVEYWHGAHLERKLTAWGKWKPSKQKKTNRSQPQHVVHEAKSQVAASSDTLNRCSCGGILVKKRNKKDGTYFWGCSEFPKCRKTRPI